MAMAAAGDIAGCLRDLLSTQRQVRMVFASAPSQAEMLAELARLPGIDWNRVTAFHMDEYIGLRLDHPAAFGGWLARHFLDKVPLGASHLMDPGNDPQASSARYASLLDEAPIDIVCLGIGVNGHIAFNDPPVADFADPLDVKVVTLDETCRRQQVDEGCFERLDLVPSQAMTMTIPRLLAAGRLFAVVPGALKRDAVRRTLQGPIETACPASILRTHKNCTLYLDKESDPNG
jgi:glucosamine-6-phosphate deaminase